MNASHGAQLLAAVLGVGLPLAALPWADWATCRLARLSIGVDLVLTDASGTVPMSMAEILVVQDSDLLTSDQATLAAFDALRDTGASSDSWALASGVYGRADAEGSVRVELTTLYCWSTPPGWPFSAVRPAIPRLQGIHAIVVRQGDGVVRLNCDSGEWRTEEPSNGRLRATLRLRAAVP